MGGITSWVLKFEQQLDQFQVSSKQRCRIFESSQILKPEVFIVNFDTPNSFLAGRGIFKTNMNGDKCRISLDERIFVTS